MARNPKRIPVQIVNPPAGARDVTSLAHARRYVARGVARFTAGGFLEFLHRRAAANGPQFEVAPFRAPVCDSGFSTAAYPMASQSEGPKYPSLSRPGAGL